MKRPDSRTSPHHRWSNARAAAPGPTLLAAGLLLACSAACSAPRASTRGPSRASAEGSVAGVQGEGPAPAEEVVAGVGEGEAPESDAKRALPVQGFLGTRYRYRSGGGSDHDLSTTLGLRVGKPDEDPFTLHLLAWANADLGGRRGSDDPFFDINDTYSKDVTGRLYEAYVDAQRVDGLGLLRLGRQPVYETPEYVTFDGLRLESEPLGGRHVRWGAYGGIPVHHFESSSNGDSVLGAYVDLLPWENGRARLDYMLIEDRYLFGDQRNDLLGLQVWQNVGPNLRLEGAYTLLEGESRDFRGRASWFEVEQDLVVRATYYELLETQRDLVNEFDPFYAALREYYPFREVQLLVSKGFAERYRADVGAQLRRLRDDGDEGEFNREFERYHARLVIDDVFVEDLALGVTGEVHDAGSGKYTSWSADLERRWSERWKTVVGTFYALYDFDLLSLRERNDVRVYFLDVALRASDATRVGARYEFEDDDLDDYHVLRVGLTWRF